MSNNTGVTAPKDGMDIKLVYTDFYGIAEPLRMMFASKNVTYKEECITIEQWAKMKNTPAAGEFNCLPHLIINGKNN